MRRFSAYVWKRTALVSIIAATVSISISTGIRFVIGAEADLVTIIVRLVLPFLIAIPICLVWFTKLEQLDVAHQRLIRQANELMKRASTDPLTGLLNRRSFVEQFDNAQAHGLAGTFIVADVDYMKAINDRYGHLTGDDVILSVAQALTTVLGDESRIARIGGDEFCAYVPRRTQKEMDTLVGRINDLATSEARRRSGQDIEVAISIGHQPCKPGQTFRDLMARSDESLYRRKRERPATSGRRSTLAAGD